MLFTLDRKAGGADLQAAAARLNLNLVFLSAEQLRAIPPDQISPSKRVEAAVGVPSVAEAAALVGAGPGARLIVPKQAANGVTCAVALGSGAPA